MCPLVLSFNFFNAHKYSHLKSSLFFLKKLKLILAIVNMNTKKERAKNAKEKEKNTEK